MQSLAPVRPSLNRSPVKRTTRLSVVIPVFNEERWVGELIKRVQATPYEKEIIVVDDCSTDKTLAILNGLAHNFEIQLIRQHRNRGKGAALRLGLRQCSGDIIIVQDADLEYDPADYERLLTPIVGNTADVVYGSRFISDTHSQLRVRRFGNRVFTALSNLTTNLALTDMETGYKAFRREVVNGMNLKSNRFGFDPEITARIARHRNPRWRICEVPIHYCPRTYQEGKKISIRDAFESLMAIFRYAILD
ncbi:MAG: glycosyltransferase family 2 protein [Gemmataceae bacterium]